MKYYIDDKKKQKKLVLYRVGEVNYVAPLNKPTGEMMILSVDEKGKAHTIRDTKGITFKMLGSTMFLRTEVKKKISHPSHEDMTISAGIWEVRITKDDGED